MATQRIRLSWATEPFHLHLTSLHALIGPAGVGKTATLDAVEWPPKHSNLSNIFDGSNGLKTMAHLLKGHVTSLYERWDLVQKYYPWVKSIEEGDTRALPRVRSGPQDYPRDCKNYPSLAALLVAIALHDICKTHHTGLVTIDNPDQDLHPEQIADVMKLLRRTADSGVQVVLATNCPLVINEMKPEEVTLLTRGEHGPVATLLKDTWNAEQRLRVFSLGELWLNYCGNNEQGLLQEPPPARFPDEQPDQIITEEKEDRGE